MTDAFRVFVLAPSKFAVSRPEMGGAHQLYSFRIASCILHEEEEDEDGTRVCTSEWEAQVSFTASALLCAFYMKDSMFRKKTDGRIINWRS